MIDSHGVAEQVVELFNKNIANQSVNKRIEDKLDQILTRLIALDIKWDEKNEDGSPNS